MNLLYSVFCTLVTIVLVNSMVIEYANCLRWFTVIYGLCKVNSRIAIILESLFIQLTATSFQGATTYVLKRSHFGTSVS